MQHIIKSYMHSNPASKFILCNTNNFQNFKRANVRLDSISYYVYRLYYIDYWNTIHNDNEMSILIMRYYKLLTVSINDYVILKLRHKTESNVFYYSGLIMFTTKFYQILSSFYYPPLIERKHMFNISKNCINHNV